MKIKSIVYAFAVLTPIISHSQELPTEIPLWSNGVPGFESRRNKPTEAKNWWVKNIHNPSNIVYPAPRDKATGTGVVVCPDGGDRDLVFDAEGREAAEFLNSMRVTASVLKYDLQRKKARRIHWEKHVLYERYRVAFACGQLENRK